MIPDVLRPALRAVRHAPDRVWHARRRANLVGRLGKQWPREIGFICYGNICRSPYAAAAAVRALAFLGSASPRVWSAGLFGPERPSPQTAVDAARERGLNLAPHCSRLVSSGDRAADWIFVMERWQATSVAEQLGGARVALLGDLDPEPIDTRAIPDPVGRSLEDFRACYARIDRCVATLARVLSNGRPDQ